jgi:sulfate permease, SulP family
MSLRTATETGSRQCRGAAGPLSQWQPDTASDAPLFLIVPYGGGPQPAIELTAGTYILGRSRNSDIRLENPAISGLHARLTVTPAEVVVEDLRSTNGTAINGEGVEKGTLQIGDTLSFGDEVFRLEDARPSVAYAAASEQTVMARSAPVAEATGLAAYGLGAKGTRQPFHRRLAPLLEDLRRYDRDALRGDLFAGLTVAVLLVPQGMAYALLAGLPPIAGLYAALLPPLIYALLGTARQLSVGPVALDSLIVAAGVGALAQAGTEQYWVLATTLALMVGAIQFTMGLLRAGFLVNFLSSPVITGFTAAAAIIIGVSQLKHILGIPTPQGLGVAEILIHLAQHIGEAHLVTLGMGVGSLVFLQVAKRWKTFPAPLVLVAATTGIVWLGGLADAGVHIVGGVPEGLPPIALPAASLAEVRSLLPLAVTLSLVGFMQTISVGKAMAAKGRYTLSPDQELRAVGLANMGAGLTSAYPVSGGLSRSAVNARAGARTGVASMVATLAMALALLFFTPLFYYLPSAALAAIILMAVSGLIDRREIRRILRTKRSEGLVLATTFLATLVIGIQSGVLIGVIASILLFITLNTRPPAAILGRLPGTEIYRNVRDFPRAETHQGIVVLRIDASFYFANAEFIKETLRNIREDQGDRLKAVVLEAGSINDLDSTADAVLQDVAEEFLDRGIRLYIAGVKGPVREVMKRSGLYHKLGANRFFYTVEAAVRRALSEA